MTPESRNAGFIIPLAAICIAVAVWFLPGLSLFAQSVVGILAAALLMLMLPAVGFVRLKMIQRKQLKAHRNSEGANKSLQQLKDLIGR